MGARRAAHPGPEWSQADLRAGRAMARHWERFFASHGEQAPRERPQADRWSTSGADRARAEHERRLLRYPNVVGVSVGFAVRRGRPTRTPCIVVFVSKKVPRRRLAAADRIPSSLDGMRIDVVESGPVQALPAR